MPVVTARLTTNNNSHKSNQLVPVDYDDIGYQKRLIKDKVYNLGSKQLDFGKYKKFELWWVVKHNPGYINWLTRQPSPSNWLLHFLKDVGPEAQVGSSPDARLRALRGELVRPPGRVDPRA